MAGVTSEMDRPRWWSAIRGLVFFLVFGGLGTFLYVKLSHRPGGMPWGGLLLGALVCASVGPLFRGRNRR
jgi:hypothetical protein